MLPFWCYPERLNCLETTQLNSLKRGHAVKPTWRRISRVLARVARESEIHDELRHALTNVLLSPSRPERIMFTLIPNLLQHKFTGAGLNPVRFFGPAILTNKWTHHWVSESKLLLETFLFTFESFETSCLSCWTDLLDSMSDRIDVCVLHVWVYQVFETLFIACFFSRTRISQLESIAETSLWADNDVFGRHILIVQLIYSITFKASVSCFETTSSR